MLNRYSIYNDSLNRLEDRQLLITTINAHSYNVAQTDEEFNEALMNSDILIPDGVSIVWASRFLTGKKISKIAGADLFYYEMERLNEMKGKCFFLGSTEQTLSKIKMRVSHEYPNISVDTFSPPYKPSFSETDNAEMISRINDFNPDVLFVGLTAPKQEKWAYSNKGFLDVGHICCIGAVFDFYAGNITRAPRWMINSGLEWFYRLVIEPKRLWKRYLIGNFLFVASTIKFKLGLKK